MLSGSWPARVRPAPACAGAGRRGRQRHSAARRIAPADRRSHGAAPAPPRSSLAAPRPGPFGPDDRPEQADTTGGQVGSSQLQLRPFDDASTVTPPEGPCLRPDRPRIDIAQLQSRPDPLEKQAHRVHERFVPRNPAMSGRRGRGEPATDRGSGSVGGGAWLGAVGLDMRPFSAAIRRRRAKTQRKNTNHERRNLSPIKAHGAKYLDERFSSRDKGRLGLPPREL